MNRRSFYVPSVGLGAAGVEVLSRYALSATGIPVEWLAETWPVAVLSGVALWVGVWRVRQERLIYFIRDLVVAVTVAGVAIGLSNKYVPGVEKLLIGDSWWEHAVSVCIIVLIAGFTGSLAVVALGKDWSSRVLKSYEKKAENRARRRP